jgi:DNA repair protein RecO (recombination protein O)
MSAAAEPTPAIVLSAQPLGESDLLVVLLTPHAGKVRAAASGARRSKRRFVGGLAGGALGEARLAVRARGLWRLESFVPKIDHASVGRDLDRFAYVAYLCELTDALVSEPESDPARFAALWTALVQTIQSPPRPAVLRQFELRLLDSLGLLPALVECAVCGTDLRDPPPGPVAFDERRGGTVCSLHAAGSPELPGEVTRLAALLLHAHDDAPVHEELAAASAGTRRKLRDLLLGFIRPQLRRPLRSLEFFAKIGGVAGSSDR